MGATPSRTARALHAAVLAVMLAACALMTTRLAAQQPVPELSTRVTDLTGTLSVPQRARLEARLAALEQRTGTQVAVLLVASTRPETIEAYGLRVAEAWKLGRGRDRARQDTGDPRAAAIDDGVLLLVAKDDRRVRLEVGYGLEGAIPDAVARRIIDESIAPRFRSGDYEGGLEAAIDDLARRIHGEDLPAPWQPAHRDPNDGGGLLPVLATAFLIGLAVSRVAGRAPGALVGGAGAGIGAGAALASAGLGAAIGLGVAVALLAFGGRPGGVAGRLHPVGRRTIGHGPIGFPGPGWGGGGQGGSGGGGGFGGGGGRFGGGGASGGW